MQIDSNRQGYESTIGTFSSSTSTNDNGKHLKMFCNLNNTSIGNTFFKHKCIHKLTWLSPDHLTQNEIDYMLISSRWQSLFQNVCTFCGADNGSDHFLVVAKVKIKFKSLKCAKQQVPYNLNSLKCANIQNSYQEEISNMFSILSDIEDNEQQWTNFKSAVQEAAKKSIVFHRGSRREQWVSDRTWRLIDECKIIKQERDQAKSICNAITLEKKYSKLNKVVKNSCSKAKRAWMRNKCIEAEEASSRNNTKTLYKIVRDMSSLNCNNENLPIKNLQGTVLQSEEEQNECWIEHFCTVLTHDSPTELLTDIDDEVDNAVEDENMPLKPITLDEVKEGL